MNINNIIVLCRPKQWLKNILVFAGVFVTGGFTDWSMLSNALILCVSFILASSFTYSLNDTIDASSDRLHPTKRLRPIASGQVTPGQALVVGFILAITSILLANSVSFYSMLIVITYIASNVIYTLFAKKLVIVDVLFISFGFILRILIGTTGLGISPSPWILVCTLFLTLFVGFNKRFSEYLYHLNRDGNSSETRTVLKQYNNAVLLHLVSVTSALTIISYSLYIISRYDHTHSNSLILLATVLPVFYTLVCYQLGILDSNEDFDPSEVVIKDKRVLSGVLLWLVLFGISIYQL